MTRSQLCPAPDYAAVSAAASRIYEHRRHPLSLEALAHALDMPAQQLSDAFTRWNGSTAQRLSVFVTKQALREALGQTEAELDQKPPAPIQTPRIKIVPVDRSTAPTALHYGYADTPFGSVLLGWGAEGLCHLMFADTPGLALDELKQQWPGCTLTQDDQAARHWIERILAPDSSNNPLCVRLRCSPFQLRVWQALAATSPAQLLSYGQLARSLGMAGAQRAVGTAVAANPVALLIPCHRVIRESGDVGNYHWGQARKITILFWEHCLACGSSEPARTPARQ